MKLAVALLVVAAALTGSMLAAQPTEPVTADENLSIYFTTADGLFRFDPRTGNAESIDLPANADFEISNDQQRVAFWNTEHLWVSPLAAWNPALLSTWAGESITRIAWTLDDSRLLLYTSRDAPPTLAFDLNEDKLVDWNWSRCDGVVRDRTTYVLGVLCSGEDAAEVYLWGGESVLFDSDRFQRLNRESYMGSDIEWGNRGRAIAYVEKFNSEAMVAPDVAGFSFLNTASQSPDAPLFLLRQRVWALSAFRLSPDGDYIAVLIRPSMMNWYMLQIYRLDTGEPLWDEALDFDATTASDIAWYPNGEKLAVAKFIYPTSYLSIVDLASAAVQDYEVAQTTIGQVAVALNENRPD